MNASKRHPALLRNMPKKPSLSRLSEARRAFILARSPRGLDSTISSPQEQ